LSFSIHNISLSHHEAGNFFIALHVRQEKLLIFNDVRRQFNEAAVGIDLHGLSDFFEGLIGGIVAVDEYRNSEVYSRASRFYRLAICHGASNA
jgi:hypothetical protein